MANQVVKQCYACKAEDHEIKDSKKRINILLRCTDSRYTSTREMKEKVWPYGRLIIIKKTGKVKMRKCKKKVWYVLRQKQKQKEQWEI